MGVDVPQSIPICAVLAAVGGILEVLATAVLAYPAAKIAEGFVWTDRQLKACLAINILLQILASLAGNLFACWFGPVAIVGPIFFSAQLLANLLVFWIALGLELFSREMQIGTYVIVVAVILLIVNGPSSQTYADQTFQDLLGTLPAILWTSVLVICMLGTGLLLPGIRKFQSKRLLFVVLLVARASAFSLNLSTGKALVLPNNEGTDTLWLSVNIVMKVLSGLVYTGAIVVQSTAVEQRIFVPLNAACIVLVNAITGIILWEDWRVVQSWIGYTCVFLLLALGCGLLLGDLGLLQETCPETFRGARPTIVLKENREKLLENLRHIRTASSRALEQPSSFFILHPGQTGGAGSRREEQIVDEEDNSTCVGTNSNGDQSNAVSEEVSRLQRALSYHPRMVREHTARRAPVTDRRNSLFPLRRRRSSSVAAWMTIYETGRAAPNHTSVRNLETGLSGSGRHAHSGRDTITRESVLRWQSMRQVAEDDLNEEALCSKGLQIECREGEDAKVEALAASPKNEADP